MNNGKDSSLTVEPNLLIATPMYGGMCTATYTSSIISLFTKFGELGWNVSFAYLSNHSVITKARNSLVNAFLLHDFTHLLFIDADISFNADDVIKMIKEDKPVIGGIYPAKEINWSRVKEVVDEGVPVELLPIAASRYIFNVGLDGDPNISGRSELKEVVGLGTGYMLIKREVFDKLSPHVDSYYSGNRMWFFGKQEPETTKEFFKFDIAEDGRFLSEDYYFCEKWISLGEKVYAAEWAYAQHTGTHTFG